MEKVISIGKVIETREGRTQQNKPYATIKISIKVMNVEVKRNYIANNEYLINKIRQCKQGDIVGVESTLGKVVNYKNNNGETSYTINFHLNDIHNNNVNNGWNSNHSYSYNNNNNNNEPFELNLDFLDNEKI